MHIRKDKKQFKKAFWSSLARTVGVLLTFSAGTALRQVLGDNMAVLAITGFVGFILMLVAEYLSGLE